MIDRPSVAVIDYGIGNLRSAEKALQRVGADATLTTSSDAIASADAVVLPGVGNFGRCMEALHETELAQPALDAVASGRPFFGICVGMQMLFESSEESPDRPGLGVLPGQVVLLPDTVKRPQMQWNAISTAAPHPVAESVDGEWMYFVHSYAVTESPAAIATCDYGGSVVAIAGQDNVLATQFHPEKSGRAGLTLLQAFVEQIPQRVSVEP
ncbi:MAG: imidazole glycerol phosphate synthase subunit HisH [Actinomycetota bacterium]